MTTSQKYLLVLAVTNPIAWAVAILALVVAATAVAALVLYAMYRYCEHELSTPARRPAPAPQPQPAVPTAGPQPEPAPYSAPQLEPEAVSGPESAEAPLDVPVAVGQEGQPALCAQADADDAVPPPAKKRRAAKAAPAAPKAKPKTPRPKAKPKVGALCSQEPRPKSTRAGKSSVRPPVRSTDGRKAQRVSTGGVQ